MSSLREGRVDWTNLPVPGSKILVRAALLAIVVEFTLLTIMGWQSHWLAHPQSADSGPKFIEAEVFQMPKLEHLMDEKKIAAPAPHEAVLSKVPNQGKKAPEKAQIEEQNQTKSGGPPMAPTHGPIAIFSPPPVIPDYLRDKDLNTSAVIDFLISAQGGVTPRLVGSTGNEELDALAIKTAQKWQFRPAEKDHKAVDSKIRLRIIFNVH
jgi:TonB family protein